MKQRRQSKADRVSRHDVAVAAGVSDAMVSFALSSRSKVKIRPETRARILKAVEELGYIPNFIGKALVERRTYNIGYVMPERSVSAMAIWDISCLHGVSAAISNTEYNLVIYFGVNDKLFRQLKQGRLDGLIVFDLSRLAAWREAMSDFAVPVVLLNAAGEAGGVGLGTVCSDEAGVMAQAFAHFEAARCRRLLMLTRDSDFGLQAWRERLFAQALAARDGWSGTILSVDGHARGALAKQLPAAAAFDGVLFMDYRAKTEFDQLFPDYSGARFVASVLHSGMANETAPILTQPSVQIGTLGGETVLNMIDGAPARHLTAPYIEKQPS